MKQVRIHLIAGIVFLGLALRYAVDPPQHARENAPIVQNYYPHICSDTTHLTCDGECICDGMECPK